MRGRGEVRVRRRWPGAGRGLLLQPEQIVVRADRDPRQWALARGRGRFAGPVSCPAARRGALMSSQSVVDQVEVGEGVALAEELSLRAGRCPHDVALCPELVRGVARKPEVVEDVA